MLRSFVAILPFVLAPMPAAALNWYMVEIIVFEHREDAARTDEHWPRDPGRPDFSDSVALVPPTDPRTLQPFEQLLPEQTQLGGALRTLDRSSRYQPLVHVGWLQPGLSRAEAPALRIDMESAERLAPVPLVVEPEPDPLDQPAPVEDDEFDPSDEPHPVQEDASMELDPWLLADQLRSAYASPTPPQRLQGNVTLILQRFLHLEFDLVYTSDDRLPEPDEGGWSERRNAILDDFIVGDIGFDEAHARLEALEAEPRNQAYRLQERRRVRLNEVHYFDHPMVGVIALVRPLPADEVEARQAAWDAAHGIEPEESPDP